MVVTPCLGSLRLEDCCKSEVGLANTVSSRTAENYTMRLCLRTEQNRS